MNSLDLYILIPVVGGLVFGLFRGFVREVISIATIILGLICARLFNEIVAGWLADFFDISLKSAKPLAFIVIFICVGILLKIFGKLIHNAVKMMSLGIFNALLGAMLGGAKWLLIVSILLNLLSAVNDKITVIDAEMIDRSLFYKPAKNFGPDLWKDIRHQNEIK